MRRRQGWMEALYSQIQAMQRGLAVGFLEALNRPFEEALEEALNRPFEEALAALRRLQPDYMLDQAAAAPAREGDPPGDFFHLRGPTIGGGATIGQAVIGVRLLAREIRPGDYELLHGEEVVGTVHIDFSGARGRLLAGWDYGIPAAEFEALWRDNKNTRIKIAHRMGVDERHVRRLARKLGLHRQKRGRKLGGERP